MIFISAQPDEFYFFWQLELQIFNFKKLNIDLNKLHILIGYDEKKKLSDDYRTFVKKFKFLNIFTYPDTREKKTYASSLRPHVLSKHFQRFPFLEEENFFYHDSDIIFSKPIDFESLLKDEAWYVSDTRNYLDSNYIKKSVGEQTFLQLCCEIGIDPKDVQSNDSNAGGSQYLLKKPTAQFWKTVEEDSEKIYSFLTLTEIKENRQIVGLENKPYIQKWCADMWALFWNALKLKKNIKIHDELNFCWINSPISNWYNTKILHYTGFYPEQKGYIFNKEDFLLYSPYYEVFEKIAKDSCSYPFIQLIEEFRVSELRKRKKIKDVTFLIPIKIDSIDRIRNLYASINFINNNFDTKIIVAEIDQTQNINPSDLPLNVKYMFKKTNNPRLFRTQVNNALIRMSVTKFIAIYDADVIIPKKQITKAINILRKGVYKSVSPYDGTFLNVDILMKELFIKIMDDTLLEVNQLKFGISSKRSFGGCLFLDKSQYLNAGMENENLTSWGPDDLERVKRLQILGLETLRLRGNLYHLHHERKIDSGYKDSADYEKLMLEYVKISSLTKEELINYIISWKWRTK